MPPPPDPLFASHPRSFADNLYVYPVLSRRAGGISIGINLNHDKFCNFRCIYCQVDRNEKSEGNNVTAESVSEVDLPRLAEELDRTIAEFTSGKLFAAKRFNRTPESLRRLNDIALSGDGEPTACREFAEAAALCAKARMRHRLDNAKLVLITNATLLHLPKVQKGLEVLDLSNGEIWAKLDAGTEPYYAEVARSAVSWRRILDNLRETACVRPIVIQTLFMRIRGQSPPPTEIAAYCERLREIVAGGGKIKLVQIHTVAREPAESFAAPLSDAEVAAIADRVRRETQLPVAAFHAE